MKTKFKFTLAAVAFLGLFLLGNLTWQEHAAAETRFRALGRAVAESYVIPQIEEAVGLREPTLSEKLERAERYIQLHTICQEQTPVWFPNGRDAIMSGCAERTRDYVADLGPLARVVAFKALLEVQGELNK